MQSGAMDFASWSPAYRPGAFFTKYVTSFVPLHLSSTAREIEAQTGRSFWSAWSWAFDQLMALSGTPYAEGEVGSYSSRHGERFLRGPTSRISHVYKSSFVRTVEWFLANGWITRIDACDFAYATCPIDLSLWTVLPNPVPEWWPRAAPSGTVESLQEWQTCQELLQVRERDHTLLAAEGAVLPHGERKLISTWFSLMPFGYRVTDTEMPTAQAVPRFLSRAHLRKLPDAPHPFAVLREPHCFLPFFEEPDDLNGLRVRPVVSHCASHVISAWQPWRSGRGLLMPAFELMEGGTVEYSVGSWSYAKAQKPVFVGRDWKLGPGEWRLRGEYPTDGQYAFVESNWVEEHLAEGHWRLGFALTMLIKHRKTDYSDPQEIRQDTLLNVGSLIF